MTSPLDQVRIAARVRLALRAAARADALPAPAQVRRREERLRQLRRFATERSPWYREMHRGLEAAPLAALPVLTKDELVDHFDELVSDRQLRYDRLRRVVDGELQPEALRGYRIGASSGSSGRPGLFPFSRPEWVQLIANAARARAVAGPPPGTGPARTARIGSPSPWHLSRQVATTLHDPRRPSLTLSAATDVGDLAAALQAWQPQVLSGYPSVVAALADVQAAGDLSITPRQVFTGGEHLTPGARQRIEDVWGVRPFDQYLTTEAGFVAIECPHHTGLHALDDHVVVEVVDRDGTPVARGATGDRVLISVLGSRSLPLIRYELGDTAVLADGPCECGRRSPRLRSVTSGARSLLRIPSRHGGDVLLHPVAITAVLDAAAVRAWQVVHEPGFLRVLVAGPSPAFDGERVASALQAMLADAGGVPHHVEVTPVDSIVRSPSGKAALVVSGEAGPPV